MTISYTTGALNPASTTLAHDLRRAWKAAFDSAIASGKTNWSIVEHDYTPSGATTERTVIANTAGFVYVMTTSTVTSNPYVNVWMGSSYATPTISGLASNYTGGTMAGGPYLTTADGSFTTTLNPTIINTGLLSGPGSGQYVMATGSQTAFTAHIENTYAILSFNDGSATKGKWVHVGEITNIIGNSSFSYTKPYALTVSSFDNASAGCAVLQSVGNFNTQIRFDLLRPGGSVWSQSSDNHPADTTFIDKYNLNARPTISPFTICRQTSDIMGLDVNSSASSHGWKFGQLKDIYHAGGSLAAYGDTFEYNSKTYKYIGGLYDNLISGKSSLAGWALIN